MMPGNRLSRPFLLVATVLGLPAAGAVPAGADDPPFVGPPALDRAPSRPALLRPPPLRPGDAVALIGPASPVARSEIDEAAANLRRMGYRVKAAPQASEREGYLAGTDADRVDAINRAFADPDVRLILCVRGGYGSPRILDRIDYALVKRSPKAIVGFSDISALLIALHQKTGLVTFHGPMAGKDFTGRGGIDTFSESHLFGLIGPGPFRPDAPPFDRWGDPGDGELKTFRGGFAEGPLTGGNLSTIAALMGTPFEIDTRGTILFIEDVNEEPFRIDRMLCGLRLAGKLAAVRGVILGGFTRCAAKSPRESLNLSEVLEDYFGGLGVPVLAGFPAGHIPRQATLPLGVRVRLDATARTLTILEPAVAEPAPPPPGPTEVPGVGVRQEKG